jgi:selenocysteine lyase/cysteine desulfurase
MLYIHPGKLKKLSPLFGEVNFADDDIRKMERLGTLEPPVFLTLPVALDFHHFIGAKRKEQRLFALKNYWAEKIARIPRVKINTPLTPGHSGAIGNFSIEGIENKQVVKELFDRHRIFVNDTDDFPVQGVRVTVHLYTTQNDLDTFVGAIEEIAKR